jgi:hypothetical protein
MNYFLSKLRDLLRHTALYVVVFGIAALVILYLLGYYDFSFLDRYKVLYDTEETSSASDEDDIFASLAGLTPDDISDDITLDTSDENTAESADSSSNGASSGDRNGQSTATGGADRVTNVKKVYSSDMLDDRTIAVPKVSVREEDGYTAVDTYYTGDEYSKSGGTVLGRMSFSYKLPTAFSRRVRSVTKDEVVTPDDDTESYVKTVTVQENAPAVELYMGYILLDSGEEIYLVNSDGEPLSRFAYDKYSPAYMRDKDGNPVFMKTDGDETVYYTLSDDGKSFHICDIESDGDNVGFNFDYPLSFGQSDSTSVYPVRKSDIEKLSGDETSTEEASTEEASKNDESDEKSDLWGYAVLDENGELKGMLTEYKYTSAYGYTSNRAAVVEDGAERGAMYFIDENGRKAFENIEVYVNQYDRYVEDFILPPLTNGIESIGFYYFDHGLTRIRRQTVDYYNYAVRRVAMIVEDVDVLVHADGSEYALPAGYTLKGYSEGMAVLEKDGKYGIFSVEGEWIAQPIYADATPFIGGLSVLETGDGRYGMIDEDGEIVLPFTYDYLTQNSSGVIAAYRIENGWTIFKIMSSER